MPQTILFLDNEPAVLQGRCAFSNEFEIDTSVTTSTLILKLTNLLVAGEVDDSAFVVAANVA